MSHGHPTRRRRIAGFAPLLLALGALPLLAPTCGPGTEGLKTFARGSLIIPMDRCYQLQVDSVSGSAQPAACPQAADPGNVIRAYGLVYQLVRNNIAVHWIIDPQKSAMAATITMPVAAERPPMKAKSARPSARSAMGMVSTKVSA